MLLFLLRTAGWLAGTVEGWSPAPACSPERRCWPKVTSVANSPWGAVRSQQGRYNKVTMPIMHLTLSHFVTSHKRTRRGGCSSPDPHLVQTVPGPAEHIAGGPGPHEACRQPRCSAGLAPTMATNACFCQRQQSDPAIPEQFLF